MKSHSNGFTLIELLLSISIALIVLGSFYELTTFIYRDYAAQIALVEARQESRVATTFFQNEIQNAGLNPKGTAFDNGAGEPIVEASETVFHFMGDKNGNGTLNVQRVDTNEDVRYEWIGDRGKNPYTLYRENTDRHPQEVALGIASFRLDYFDENGNHLPAGFLTQTNRTKIRKVVLTLRPLIKENAKEGRREWVSEIYLKNIG